MVCVEPETDDFHSAFQRLDIVTDAGSWNLSVQGDAVEPIGEVPVLVMSIAAWSPPGHALTTRYLTVALTDPEGAGAVVVVVGLTVVVVEVVVVGFTVVVVLGATVVVDDPPARAAR